MKKFLFLVLALGLTLSLSAQFKSSMLKQANHIAPALSVSNIDLPVIVGELPPNNNVSNKKSINDDPVSSITRYDVQSNSAMGRRLFLYPDGTVGTAATWSTQDALWTDRGTGYNYFDGTAFGSLPTARVEAIRVGWPNYLPFGANGELIIAHEAAGNLVLNTRTTKGTGAWTQQILPNAMPSGVPAMLWPRAMTNGTNRTNIHIIALTEPVGNGGAIYNGIDGALMYCHSLDGGVTFSAWAQLPGTTSTSYTMFAGDSYSFAEPKGDTLAFTFGGDVTDLVLMKSTDNGTTWTKTIIWHSLYSLGGTSPSFYNACGGAQTVVLDNQGFAHVACGFNQDSAYSASNHYYNRIAFGIIYWNEHMPQLDQSLDPTILFVNHQWIGWLKDTNVMSFPLANLTITGGSLTWHPQLVIDNRDKIFLIYDAATTLVDANGFNFHHIFGRDGTLSADTVKWSNDSLVDITGDWIQYNFSECVYPSASPTTEQNYVYILFQKDDYAGEFVTNLSPGQTSPSDNSMVLLKWLKPVMVGVNDKHEKPTFSIGQNFPNPAIGLTKVNVYMQNSGDLSLKVTNLTGQTLMSMEKTNVLAGVNEFVIDASQLSSGVYFYTVKQGDKSITKKMIVQ
jgi:Secretion system C-terminal sorting domain